MAPQGSFQYEVEKSTNDGYGDKNVTTIRCHGRLVAESADELKQVVKPLLPQGGRIIIDLGDLSYMDSSGLGTLLSLKVSAIRQGYCTMELMNITPSILKLLRLTNLESIFAPYPPIPPL
jgi:anti-anti-sigma factor